jgi:formate hydrogenlyase transcriptional activator
LQSICCVPLLRPHASVGVFVLGSTRPDAFQPDDLNVLNQVAAQLAIAIENHGAAIEIEALKRRLSVERGYLETTERSEGLFTDIIGHSPALRQVLDQVLIVAPSDATVLVLGETGTGKELIAHAIHRSSQRKDGPFIKLNCAAIPTGLVESELFGHEKGAFTGAVNQKVGRMELAHGGTLFLDEVGEISLDLQPKLLRVLQDHEFERLGSTRTLKIDVRLIAATNRELAQEVADHLFRSDLYYRLNVFPIRVPALRERREDIPDLVRYFVHKFAIRMKRNIESIPTETMEALMQWWWPGNVRELENLIERSVILTQGNVLNVPLAELHSHVDVGSNQPSQTLNNAEREHIIRVLSETNGVLSGPQGAAQRLGLKRTTLQSKMQRLKITRRDYMGTED